MAKKIKHMGMEMTEEEHEKWHREHQKMTPEEHKTFMEKMDISEEEDEKWHEAEEMPPVAREKTGRKPVNPFAIGGGFLAYCVKQGWLAQEGAGHNAKYYVTKEGETALGKFGIKV